MARRATIIEQIRKQYPNTLLVDAGDMFSTIHRFPELHARTVFSAMEKMDYDAINVADGDLSLGTAFFDSLSKHSALHLVSANLNIVETAQLVYPPYVVKDYGTFKVGVMGLTETQFFSETCLKEGDLASGESLSVLRKYLPEIRQHSDIIVLLSHLGKEGTIELLRQDDIDGIDVAIVGHNSNPSADPVNVEGTLVVQNGVKGEYIGKLVVTVGEAKQITGFKGELVRLTSDIPDSPWAAEMMSAFQTDEIKLSKQNRKARQARERQEQLDAMVQKQMELLKMPPEEAIKNLPVPTQKLY